MANSWGESPSTWSQGDWGQQNVTTVVISSGFSITGSVGTPEAYNVAGWGRNGYGDNSWGVEGIHIDVPITGLSITGSLNADGLLSYPNTGWGRSEWGEEPWGESYNPVINLTGFGITASLGTLPYAQSESGWGRDEWGIGNWGQNTTTVVLTDSFAITAAQGPSAWGQAPWNEMIGWGGDLRCETTQLSVEALTGIEATASLGTATISRLDMIFDITGPAAMGAGIGTPNINDGADHSQGLASFLNTGSLGTPVIELGHTLASLEATMSLGTIAVTNEEIVYPTGISMTAALGSLATIDDMMVGVSGLSITGSIGTFTITDMQVGLSGLEMSGSLGSGGVSPLHYKDVDITGNTSYTYVEHSA